MIKLFKLDMTQDPWSRFWFTECLLVSLNLVRRVMPWCFRRSTEGIYNSLPLHSHKISIMMQTLIIISWFCTSVVRISSNEFAITIKIPKLIDSKHEAFGGTRAWGSCSFYIPARILIQKIQRIIHKHWRRPKYKSSTVLHSTMHVYSHEIHTHLLYKWMPEVVQFTKGTKYFLAKGKGWNLQCQHELPR